MLGSCANAPKRPKLTPAELESDLGRDPLAKPQAPKRAFRYSCKTGWI